MTRLLFFVFLLLGFCLPGFSALGATPAPLPVLVSIAPQKYLVERIAGDAVSVTVLVKPGSDPHAYEPSPGQIRAAGLARVWFTMGVPFEDAWLPRITDNAPQLETVSLISGIRRLKGADASAGHVHDHDTGEPCPRDPEHVAGSDHEEHSHGHDGEDPHVWLSPMLVRKMLPAITRTLGKRMPDRAATFRANAAALDAELEALDEELALKFAPIPRDKRVFLTFHPSWRYFAFNYQLTELSIEVDGKEPGPKTLQKVADAAKEFGITTVFVEPQFPKGAAGAVAEALGATIVIADPLAENLISLYREMAEHLLASFQRQE